MISPTTWSIPASTSRAGGLNGGGSASWASPYLAMTRRRLRNFRANRRGFWSLWIFLVLFVLSLFAEFIANDKPLLVRYEGQFYSRCFSLPRNDFGGFLPTETDYRDPEVRG